MKRWNSGSFIASVATRLASTTLSTCGETDGDPDDTSNRDTSITVDGTPQRGWTDLPDDAQEELDYVFRGVGVVTDAKDDGTDGGGAAWTDADAGTGSESVTTTNTVSH